MTISETEMASISGALRAYQRANATLEDRLRADGLTLRELSICTPLLTGEVSNTRDLAEWAGQLYSSTAAAISRLTKRGLIESGRQPGNRRLGALRLTEPGRQSTTRGLGIMAEWLKETPACAQGPSGGPCTLPAP